MKHLQGGKFAGSHTTAIEAAIPLLQAAERIPEVQKIILGFIKSTNGQGYRNVKMQTEATGLKLTIRGASSVQEVRIYTNQKELVADLLTAEVGKRFPN